MKLDDFERRRACEAFTRVELIVLVALVAIITSWLALPSSNAGGISRRSLQTRDLSNAKLIRIALQSYAVDHDGQFPWAASGVTVRNANDAFSVLIPEYVPNKFLFYLKGSAWTPNPPDEKNGARNVLKPGENHYSYVPNLSATSNPMFPIVADGFSEHSPGIYSSNKHLRGGVWKGKIAIVVRVDGSAKPELVNPADLRVYNVSNGKDLFAPAHGWLRKEQSPLNPTVQ